MKTKRRLLWAAVAALLGCAQPQVREETRSEAAGMAENVLTLREQVASLQRYAAQMEKTYAAQEAEILTLRRTVASSETCSPPAPTAQAALQRAF